MDKNNEKVVLDLVETRLSFSDNLIYAIQHVFVMVAGAVAVPIIVGGAAGLSADVVKFLVSCSLLAAGFATLVQTLGLGKHIGARIPVIEGPSFATVSIMVSIVTIYAVDGNGENGLREIAGCVLFAGLFCFLGAGVWGRLLKFFPPIVTGTVLTVLGITLFSVGIKWVATVDGKVVATAPAVNIAIATITLLLIVVFSKLFKGILGNLTVLLGLLCGTVVAMLLGVSDFSAVGTSSYVELVRPLKFGMPIFNPVSIISFLLIMLVIMTEATGNIIGIHTMSGKKLDNHNLSRGLRSSGLSTMFSAIFNSYPVTPFTQNVGMLALTRVFSRHMTATAGVILVLLAFLPKFAALFAAIPKPVLGGAGFIMFGVVAVSGLRTLGKVNYDGNKNALIVAISIGVSMIPTVIPEFFANTPDWLATLLYSNITLGCLSAILLNIFFNIIPNRKDKAV